MLFNVTYQYNTVDYNNYYSIQQEPGIASSGESDEENQMVMTSPGNTSVSVVPNVLHAYACI